MVIFVDMDGTICQELSPFDRPLAKPLAGALDGVNKLVAEGHTVVIWTARGWDQYRVTKKWLDDHGFQYAQILMGKPIANLIIDDRARQFVGWDVDYTRKTP
jgi:hydroxymethylpyrimidine pyrophosphatase-like HAD family hydrolase